MAKTFTFKKGMNDINRFDGSKVAVVDGHKIELKNVREIPGHDDSLPYVADLIVDGKKVASLHNDGWGGETDITPTDKGFDVAKFEKESFSGILWATSKIQGRTFEISLELPFLCDMLAFAYV